MVGVPTGQLEEGRDQLEIRCLADANPPASIVWRKTKSPGVTEVASIGEILMFSPIYRIHAAVYLCEASNIEGESSPVSVHVSVNCTYVCVCVLLGLVVPLTRVQIVDIPTSLVETSTTIYISEIARLLEQLYRDLFEDEIIANDMYELNVLNTRKTNESLLPFKLLHCA